MAIPNYVHPQLTIAQVLARTPAATVSRINPIVVGPQYLLSRYGSETLPSFAFSTTAQLLPFQYESDDAFVALNESTHEVDTTWVRVFGEDLEASLATFLTGDAQTIAIAANDRPNVLKLSANHFVGSSLHTKFNGRAVQVGDLVYVTNNGQTRRRVVTGFEGVAGSSSKGANTAGNDNAVGNSSYNPVTAAAVSEEVVTSPAGYTVTLDGTNWVGLTQGAKVGNAYGEEYTLKVSTPGIGGVAKFDITSLSGGWNEAGVATTAPNAGEIAVSAAKLGGLDLVITGAALSVGQTFVVRVFGIYERLGATQLAVTGTYTGPSDTTYLVEVVTGDADGTWTGAQVRVTDTAGIDTPETVTITDGTAFDLGNFGLTFEFDSTTDVDQLGLRKGDIYYVHAKAAQASTTNFDKIVLDGPAVDTSVATTATALQVEFRLAYTGEITADAASDESQWTIVAGGVQFQANAALNVTDRTSSAWCPFVNAIGTLFVSYRALVLPATTETWLTIDSASDLSDKLGTVDPDNELAYGANWTLSGAQGRRVYALRTAGTDATAFAAALKKIEATDMVYALAIVSDDVAVKQLAAQHALTMSDRKVKNFRRVYVGTDSPGSYKVLDKKSDNTNFTAQVLPNGSDNTLVVFGDASAVLTSRGIVAGDRVVFPVLDQEFEVSRVISTTEIELVTGPGSPISPAAVVEIWKADTPESQATYVRNASKALGTRRAVNVWVENGTAFVNGNYEVIPNRFVACEVAGLRCAVLPQQGLTRTELKSIQSAPAMYSRYSKDLLDAIAADGVFVVTQDAESGAVYIRHQLTTDPNNGSLYYEDSIGVNLDNISFRVKDILDGYVGKKNATARTVAEIRSRITNLLNEQTQVGVADIDIGPALIRWENLVVEIDAVLKDRINVSATLIMPLPLNNIDVVLQANVDV